MEEDIVGAVETSKCTKGGFWNSLFLLLMSSFARSHVRVNNIPPNPKRNPHEERKKKAKEMEGLLRCLRVCERASKCFFFFGTAKG